MYQPTEGEVNVLDLGIRRDSFHGDDMFIGNDEYHGKDGEIVTERSIIAVADDGCISMAVPLVDVLKYVLQQEPHLLERAKQELQAQ